jgi:ubiquinone biosynthesis protein
LCCPTALLRVRRRFRSDEAAAELVQAVHRQNARRVLASIVELQGLFIKVGQLISVMANMLPEAFRKELQTLQDRVPPRPYEDIEARLVAELGGREPSQVFAQFDRTPVASASIGQVHVACLHSGEKVAVKVQYPGIETIVKTDLGVIRRIFSLLRRFLPDWGWATIYREIREMVLAELDYQHEAAAIRAIAANFTNRKDVVIPRVIDEFSTERVLTTEWMTGIRVGDIETLDACGVDRKQAARLCVEAYCKQIFVDGVYHADPHPGNLLLRPPAPGEAGPTVVFLDFGATARVSQGMRKGIVTFLQGAMTRDVGRIVTSLKEMGFLARHADHEVFDRVVQHFYEHFRAADAFRRLLPVQPEDRSACAACHPARPARSECVAARPDRRLRGAQGMGAAGTDAASSAWRVHNLGPGDGSVGGDPALCGPLPARREEGMVRGDARYACESRPFPPLPCLANWAAS